MRLWLARHPDRLSTKREIIIDELLGLVANGRNDAVSTMVGMLADLHQHGRESRYLEKLKKLPLFELKSASRGGEKGGSRIYLFFLANGDAGVVNCEVKEGDAPGQAKLELALEVLVAYRSGVKVFG
ncbi:hypothetical protein [Longimicrobium sp.]|uniref:hypothetical protein n=1 Tax=Longimicrobium sp. TaxID=2029185 RepID=UPI003B3A2BB1